jgi:hypothetical protein
MSEDDDPFAEHRRITAEWLALQELKARNRQQPEPPPPSPPKPAAPSVLPQDDPRDDAIRRADHARAEYRRTQFANVGR